MPAPLTTLARTLGFVALAHAPGAFASAAQPLPPADNPEYAPVYSRTDAMTAVLRDALSDHDPRQRHRLLSGLRKLRDPSLLPIFTRLSTAGDPLLRAHGLLGAAELDKLLGLDLLTISKMDDQDERGVLLGEAIERGLLDQDQMHDVLRWQSLGDETASRVLARLAATGKTPPRSVLERLLASEDPVVRLRAALASAQAALPGEHARVITSAADDLLTRPAREGVAPGRDRLRELLGEVRSARLWTGGAPLARFVHERAGGDDPLLAFEALATRLAAEPGEPGVLGACRASLAPAREMGERLRTSLAILESGLARGRVSPELVELLTRDPEPLIAAQGAAARALADTRAEPTAALVELAGFHHAPSTRWLLSALTPVPGAQARAVRLRVLDCPRQRLTSEIAPLMQRAARELAQDDPALLEPVLDAALKDEREYVVHAALSGAVQSERVEVWPLASRGAPLPRPGGPWPDELASALATLLLTRQPGPIPDHVREQRLDALASVAKGRGGLGPVLQFLAAWQALRLEGQDKPALARVLSETR